jgi:hypothetical protein
MADIFDRVRYTETRARGYIEDWNPTAGTQATLFEIQSVLSEYRAHLPMTARQIFYRLIGRNVIAKTEQSYQRLLSILTKARRAEIIPFSSIRDDGTEARHAGGYDDPDEFASYLARNLEVFADVRGGDLFLAVVVHRGEERAGHEYRSGHYVREEQPMATEVTERTGHDICVRTDSTDRLTAWQIIQFGEELQAQDPPKGVCIEHQLSNTGHLVELSARWTRYPPPLPDGQAGG